MNPTNHLYNRAKSLIDEMVNLNIIEFNQSKKMYNRNAIVLRIYELPKLHKPDIPLRLILSNIGSPAYHISKYISNILKKLTLNSQFNIQNSFQLVEKISNKILKQNETLVSFDVVSLFTNITLIKVLQLINIHWNQIDRYTNLNKDQFLTLVRFCIIENNYFSYNNTFFRQKSGLAMGNPLSPILADIVMEDLFKYASTRIPHTPTLLFKYVDDILITLPIEAIETTKTIFESYNSKIKFTVELEQNNKIPFLDILIARDENGQLNTNWYKKSTSSDRILNFLSSHPFSVRKNVAEALIKRMLILSDKRFYHSNKKIIFDILQKNNYPMKLIKNLWYTNLQSINYNKTVNDDTGNESDSWPIGKTIPTFIFHNSYQNNHTQIKDNTIIGSLTYVQGLTGKVKGVIANNNYTKIGLKTNNTAEKNIYTNTKDKIKKLNNTNVIYEVQCQGCDSKYIGETKNKLLERLQQHKNNVKNRSNTTALSKHCTKHEF